jgi:hypothetical protein
MTAAHLASLSPEHRAFHKRMTPVALANGFVEIGVCITPGLGHVHKMFRRGERELLRFFPVHDLGEYLWEHQDADGARVGGAGGPEEVQAHLDGQAATL